MEGCKSKKKRRIKNAEDHDFCKTFIEPNVCKHYLPGKVSLATLKVSLSHKSDLEKKAIVKGEAITSSKLIKMAMPPTIEMEISANKLLCTSRFDF